MDSIVKFEEVEKRIILLHGKNVLLDFDVAKLYGVETKRINEAVSNNPDKFPEGYIIDISKDDWTVLRSKISTLENSGRGKHSKYIPKAFTEKGLYMLATILKSEKATQTTLAIIETFANIKNLTRNIKELSETKDEPKKKEIMQKSGEIITEILDNDLNVNETETTIELNFAVLKLKHTIKRK